jgi:hypothetical protein
MPRISSWALVVPLAILLSIWGISRARARTKNGTRSTGALIMAGLVAVLAVWINVQAVVDDSRKNDVGFLLPWVFQLGTLLVVSLLWVYRCFISNRAAKKPGETVQPRPAR